MTSTESVADPITALPETHRCPACGERKQRLAQHWSHSSTDCEYPALTEDIRAVVEALVLAGATVTGQGPTRFIVSGMGSPHLAA
jgi:hypothetical protein